MYNCSLLLLLHSSVVCFFLRFFFFPPSFSFLFFFYIIFPKLYKTSFSPPVYELFWFINFSGLERHIKRAICVLMMTTVTSTIWNSHPHSWHREIGMLLMLYFKKRKITIKICKQLHFKWDLCITKQHIVIKETILCYTKDYEMPKSHIKQINSILCIYKTIMTKTCSS